MYLCLCPCLLLSRSAVGRVVLSGKRTHVCRCTCVFQVKDGCSSSWILLLCYGVLWRIRHLKVRNSLSHMIGIWLGEKQTSVEVSGSRYTERSWGGVCAICQTWSGGVPKASLDWAWVCSASVRQCWSLFVWWRRDALCLESTHASQVREASCL